MFKVISDVAMDFDGMFTSSIYVVLLSLFLTHSYPVPSSVSIVDFLSHAYLFRANNKDNRATPMVLNSANNHRHSYHVFILTLNKYWHTE